MDGALSMDLLDPDEVLRLTSWIDSDENYWLDGRLTAGEFAAAVKKNRQLDPGCPTHAMARKLVVDKLTANPLIKSFTLMKKVHSIMFSKSTEGDQYGWHVDNPYSRQGRRDISFTLFLSDPNSYDGGALSTQGSQEICATKLKIGAIHLYPSSVLHCVNQVTMGTRLVCVGWIESHVKSAEERSILFNLDSGARGLLSRHGRSDELDLIFQSYVNAVRRFSS